MKNLFQETFNTITLILIGTLIKIIIQEIIIHLHNKIIAD